MARQKRRSGLAAMAERVRPQAEKAQKKAGPIVEQAKDRLAPAVEQARDRLGPAVEEARDKVGPAMEQARTRIAEDVVPKVSAAVENATVASEPYRKEAKRRGSAAYSALKGELEKEPPKKKGRWVRRVLVVAGLGGAVAAAWRALRSGTDADWQPMPAATPPPSAGADPGFAGTATKSTTKPATDSAGAGPDEAVADAGEEPHEPTTPDQPAAKKTTAKKTSAARSSSGTRSTRSRSRSTGTSKRPSDDT